MTDAVVSSAPEGVATPVIESTPKVDAVPRAPDGKFASKTEAPTVEQTATTPEAEAKPVVDGEDQQKPEKRRSSAQDRIDRSIAEKHAARREAEGWKQKYEALLATPKATVAPDDYEGQQREQLRSVIREETAGQSKQEYEAAVQRAHQAQRAAFLAKVDAVRERIPEIDKSLQAFANLPVSEHAAEIIAESEVAAEIAHYLATNPHEAYDIERMSPAQQGRALARIEQRVSLPSKRTSSAPPPPPIVSGAQATVAKSPQEMSAAEYIAQRKKEWAKGGR